MTNLMLMMLRKIIYYSSAFSPRSEKAVMGSYENQFSDNAKYLYIHWQQTQFIRAIWISGNPEVIAALHKRGFEAYHRRSFLGLFHCLTAKYYFYNSYIGDINQNLAKGAIKVNLWHGSPLKKIEFDITSGPLTHTFQASNSINKLTNSLRYHQQHIKPDIMLSPSPMMDKLFMSAFRLSDKQMLRSGNPRTDYHKRYPEQKLSFTNLFNHHFDKVIMYAPTWKLQTTKYHQTNLQAKSHLTEDKNEINLYDVAFNWKVLSEHLTINNQLFLIRLDANEAQLKSEFNQYPNIVDISQWQDIYPNMHEVDLLITDQSSLCIDFLLNQTPTLFYIPSDIEKLMPKKESSQESYTDNYDYVDTLPLYGNDKAVKVSSFEALLMKLESDESFYISAKLSQKYKQLCNLFWSEYACDAFDVIEKQIIKRTDKTYRHHLP